MVLAKAGDQLLVKETYCLHEYDTSKRAGDELPVKRTILPVKVRHNSTVGDYTSGVEAILLAKV